MDCVTAKPYRRRVAGREYDQQKAIHDNVRVMGPHLQFLQDDSRLAGSSLTPKHWDSTGINPTASLNFFSCFELPLSLPSCLYRSRSRRLTVLLNGCCGQKKGRGLKADRFVLTTRRFKDQWDRMLNSLRASRSGKVQQTSAFTMRAIRLVIAPLHPSDQHQFQLLGPMP